MGDEGLTRSSECYKCGAYNTINRVYAHDQVSLAVGLTILGAS